MRQSRLLCAVYAVILAVAAGGCSVSLRPPPSPAGSPGDLRGLTTADVRGVLASFEGEATFQTIKVDIPDYAASILRQVPIYSDAGGAHTFSDSSNPAERRLPPAEASSTIAGAVEAFHRIEGQSGRAAAIDLMNAQSLGGEAGDPPPTPDEKLLGLLFDGMATTSLMFFAPDARDWTWRVSDISVVGTDAARVTYEVSVPAGAGWHFARSEHVKSLHFERLPDGSWLLDGWTNYAQFERRLRASVEPSGTIPDEVYWWQALGAE